MQNLIRFYLHFGFYYSYIVLEIDISEEIRHHATSYSSHPLWYKLSGNGTSLMKMRDFLHCPDYKKKLRMSVIQANPSGNNSFVYNFNDSTRVEYTIYCTLATFDS